MKHILRVILCVLVIQLNGVSAHNLTKCHRFLTKNITGGDILANGTYQYEDEFYPPGYFGLLDFYLDEKSGIEIITEPHMRGCISKVHSFYYDPALELAGGWLNVSLLYLTFIVYVVIPELRNVHGMLLLGYVGGLAVGYTYFTTIVTMDITGDSRRNDPVFTTIGRYLTYFSCTLAGFSLNTMCFNIFRTLTRLRKNPIGRKSIICYCLYTWGMTTFMTMLVFFLDISDIDEKYKPGMYFTTAYWLDGYLQITLYFYMPLLLTLIANIIFFIITVFHIRKVKSNLFNTTDSSSSSRHNDHKSLYLIFLRMLIVMGVTWSIKIAELFDDSFEMIAITNIVEILQGPLIFLVVVVFNARVRRLIIERFKKITGQEVSEQGTEVK